MTRPAVLLLGENDDIAVATSTLREGDRIEARGRTLTVRVPVPGGHKVALRDLALDEPILKFGQVIGFASREIVAGEHVHVHNCAARAFPRRQTACTPPRKAQAPLPRTFLGFQRPDGRVGTRNYVAVVSTVNCSASVARFVRERFPADGLRPFPHVDGVLAITHKGGCAIQEGGEDHAQLTRTLVGIATHPNIAAVLFLGLGCEVAQSAPLSEAARLVRIEGTSRSASQPLPSVLTIQGSGGIQQTVEAAVRAIGELLPPANDQRRAPIDVSHIRLGLQCGGSDGYSGVTANPALGIAVDHLIAAGGTAILAETPEVYGAEHLLTARAVSDDVAERLLDRIRWWEWYTGIFGVELNNNPTPGNREGGITTIYEKSLGAVAKGGSTPLVDVVRYAERVTASGLVFMDTPGYDPVSLTGVVAGGATVCAFTTGRGSVYGSKPAPSIKIATNTPLYERMTDDMDINAGIVLDGVPLVDVGSVIYERILAVASGEKTKSELQNVGDEEFAPWSVGPTL